MRKRADGGYTIAHNQVTVADIIPASFKYMKAFIPALRSEWPNLRLRVGKRFFNEAIMSSRWKLDEVSPFEKTRVLDPEPVQWVLDDCLKALQDDHPAFRGVQITHKWAGLIDVTPDADQLVRAHGMRHAGHVLFDDRPLVELLGGVVRRRSDELDPAGVRLVIRASTLKCWQKPMVDVDHWRCVGQEVGAEDLHVPREHHEIDVMAA